MAGLPLVVDLTPVSAPVQQQVPSTAAEPLSRTHHMQLHSRTIKHPPTAFHITAAADLEPPSFTVAFKSLQWRAAMTEEFNALLKNGTWELVPPPPHANIVGSKWVFRIKRKPDGSVDRFKARLVAKGYTQQEGVDYIETFSPVVKPTTIRAILTIAVSQNWPIRQLDVSNAFLHGHLQEQIYMSQPPGFVNDNHPTHVCKLHKSLYGLKQAPRAWFHRLSTFLRQLGFQDSKTDASLFYYRQHDIFIALLVYVDDIIVTGTHPTAIFSIINKLGGEFALKDLGDIHYFLGVEVTKSPSGLLLSQRRYISDLL